MKLEKLIKVLTEHLEKNPTHANYKIVIGKMGTFEYKERSLYVKPSLVRVNKDNTICDKDLDSYDGTKLVLS